MMMMNKKGNMELRELEGRGVELKGVIIGVNVRPYGRFQDHDERGDQD
jgi:hypothetical protein